MKSKKSILSFVLALCFIIPAMFFMTACGGDDGSGNYVAEYAWGKSFNYQGVMITDKNQYGPGGSTKVNLIKSEYNNIISGNESNLDFENATINGVKFDLTDYKGANANEFINNLDQIAKLRFEQMYAGYSIVVGSEAEQTVTINGVLYNLVKTNNANEYQVWEVDAQEGDSFVALLCSEISINIDNLTKGCLYLDFVSSKFFADYYDDVQIEIPTKEICYDGTANKTYGENNEITSTSVSICYTPYFSKA